MIETLWKAIARDIEDTSETQISTTPDSLRPVVGGCIHQAWEIRAGSDRWFVKTNRPSHQEMFEAESDGLAALAGTKTLRVPKVLGHGLTQDTAWLLMEFIDLRRGSSAEFQEMGGRLAKLHHAQSGTSQHGWDRNNFIGSTPQSNEPNASWASFFRDQRLAPQLALTGKRFTESRALLDAIPTLLAGHDPSPSPLHGDLWSGNTACSFDGTPVFYDPAFYWGDRETDLAFTTLFGGFPEAFYAGYESEWPLPHGHEERIPLYNLYHVLNHLHLFGEPYGQQAGQMMRRLLIKADSLAG